MKCILAIANRSWKPELCHLLESQCAGDILETGDGAGLPHQSRFLTHARLLLAEVRVMARLTKRMLGVRPRRTPILLFLCSQHLGGLLAARLAWCVGGRRVSIFMVNFYIHEAVRNKLFTGVLRFLLRQRIGMLVQSEADRRMFTSMAPHLWIAYYPYCLGELTCVPSSQITLGDYIFAGGYSNRDYGTLLAAALQMPESRFVIACSSANHLGRRLPDNVEVRTDLPPAEFHQVMAKSRLVALPLKKGGGAAGQMVALAAMQFGKCVVYAQHESVSQYFEPYIDGIPYESEDPIDLGRRLSSVVNNPEVLVATGTRAREKWDREYRRERFDRAVIESFLQYRDLIMKSGGALGQGPAAARMRQPENVHLPGS